MVRSLYMPLPISAHSAIDLDNYMKRGGTIAGKYDRLWEAQLKRRQMLAAVGNASGVFKARTRNRKVFPWTHNCLVIRYLAGVPQALLDFIHTINDDVGCAVFLYSFIA